MNNELRIKKQKQNADVINYKQRNGIVNLSIRFGKTYQCMMVFKENEIVPIIHPNIAMVDGWIEDQKKFGLEDKFKLVFHTTASLKKLVAEGVKYKFMVVDEIHKLSDAQLNNLIKLKDEDCKILALSGSISKKTLDKIRTVLKLDIIVQYSLEEAIADSLVKDYQIYIHPVAMNEVNRDHIYGKYGREISCSEKQLYDYYTETMDWTHDIVEEYKLKIAEFPKDKPIPQNYLNEVNKHKAIHTKFMGLRTNFIYNSKSLAAYVKKLVEANKDNKTLIFTLRTDVADKLSAKTHHSKNKDDKEFQEFKLAENGHLSTVNTIDVGVTIKNLNNIICHSVDSNTETFIQKIGRGLQLAEIDGNLCRIDIAVLKNTVQEKWIDKACELISPYKVNYVVNDKVISKIDYIKQNNPDKELYLCTTYNNFCYYAGLNDEGWRTYKFLGSNVDKAYCLSARNLKKL